MGNRNSRAEPIDPRQIRDTVERRIEHRERMIEVETEREKELLLQQKNNLVQNICQKVQRKIDREGKEPHGVYAFTLKLTHLYMAKNSVIAYLLKILRDGLEPKGWYLHVVETQDYGYNQKIQMSRSRDRAHYPKSLTGLKPLLNRLFMQIKLSVIPWCSRDLKGYGFTHYHTPEKIYAEEDCVICTDAKPDSLLYPCAHQIACLQCLQTQQTLSGLKHCPLCSKDIITVLYA